MSTRSSIFYDEASDFHVYTDLKEPGFVYLEPDDMSPAAVAMVESGDFDHALRLRLSQELWQQLVAALRSDIPPNPNLLPETFEDC